MGSKQSILVRLQEAIRNTLSDRMMRPIDRARLLRARIETLEDRFLLSTTPYISEFMAGKQNTYPASDGQYYDWIEIANPAPTKKSLAGYFLTDDSTDLTKWPFPAVEVAAGGFLTVLAPGPNVILPELHTDFGLASGGGYLALVAPDHTVVSAFDPYPKQLDFVAYGIAADVTATPLARSGAAARAIVPMDGSLGDGWKLPGFADGGWFSGATGIGFDVYTPPPPISGFTTHLIDVLGAITDVATAEKIALGPMPGGYAVQIDQTADAPVVNYGSGGNFGSDQLLPSGQQNSDEYVLHSTANVVIPAGTWSIDVGSDDGFKLTIPGVSFTGKVNENTAGLPTPIPADTLAYSIPRGHAHTSATFTLSQPLTTTLSLVFYENQGGDDVELSVASGTQSFNANFVLLADNVPTGWSVKTTSSTPPPDYRPLLGLNLQQPMLNRNASAYVRIPLGLVENPADFDALRLNIKYDDGFVAYLNGQEIARRNAPDALAWNSSATASRPDTRAIQYEQIDVGLPAGLLNVGNGTNVLAIQGLNLAAGDDDFLILPELYGLHTNSTSQRYFTNPTPGAANDQSGYVDIVADTKFSQDRGFYSTPFSVAITCATQGAEIRYTTDGSTPTATTGSVYASPIAVTTTTIVRAAAFKPGYMSSNVDTQSYIFPNDVIHQPVNPAGFPALGSAGVHWDYQMDPTVVSQYSSEIIDDLQAIPTLSLVMSENDWFGPNGIYVNPDGVGRSWERPVSMEYIDPQNNDQFQIDAGIRIYGGVNRSTSFPKHSFRVSFRSEYGAGKLRWPLFDNWQTTDNWQPVSEFNDFVLRGEFNNSWPFWVDSERTRGQYLQDRWISETQLAMGQPASHGNFVHLYINGLYWGLYSPTERPDSSFQASYLGGSPDDYDTIHDSEAVDGSKTAWNTLQSLAAAGVGTPAAYAAIQQYVDVDNLIDYMLLNFYGGNQDWDDHNWYAGRNTAAGEGFKFFNWDGERTLEDINANRIGVGQADKPSYIYNALRANPEFRLRFADHVYENLFNDGPLTPTQAADRYRKLGDMVYQAIVGESARWGDFQEASSGKTYMREPNWTSQYNWEMNTYFPARTAALLTQLRGAGLYPTIDAPTFSQHGGVVSPGFSLTITAPPGTIYYTLDGSDPRLPGGGVSASALVYSAAIPITDTTIVNARVLATDGTWSALDKAAFTMDLSKLRIAEIMYNPPVPPPGNTSFGAQEFEYIEFVNTGNRPLNLTNVQISGTITYDFSAGQVLGAGQRLVLVRNAAAFVSRYPGIAYDGAYTGALDNGDGQIIVTGPLGTLLDFTYHDKWYPITDGGAPPEGGYSLVAVDPAAPLSTYYAQSNWRPSNAAYGAPGQADPGFAPECVVINEVMSTAAAGDWIELYNTTGWPINVGGWLLSNDAANLAQYTIPAGTVINGHDYLVLHQSDFVFDIKSDGDDIYLSSSDGSGGVGGYRDHVDFGASAPQVTFGRYVKSTGGTDFTALSAPTMGGANALPLVGPIVISEIMYNPLGVGDEFIELMNLAGSTYPLYDALRPGNAWKFTEGVDYTFAPGTELPPSGYALVVPIAPDVFRAKYSIPAAVPIFGPYIGALDNKGENVKLARPGEPDINGVVPYITVDQVHYRNESPWPTTPDGQGPSLSRISPTAYGNDAGNWIAGPMGGTPGMPFDRPAAPSELSAAGISGTGVRVSWIDNSAEDGFRIERSADGISWSFVANTGANVTSFDDAGLQGGKFYTYRVRAFNSAGTSGWSNSASASTWLQRSYPWIAIDSDGWRYNDTATDLGTSWRSGGYDDTGWPLGKGVLYSKSGGADPGLPAPKGTSIALTRTVNGTTYDITTFYFRKHFTIDFDPSTLASVKLQTVLDDGAVIYVNGNLVRNESVPANSTLSVSGITRTGSTATVTTSAAHGYKVGEIVKISGANQSAYNGTFTIVSVATTTFTYTVSGTPATPATGSIKSLRTDFGTYASRTVSTIAYEGPFDVPISYLKQGDNVIAVDVHNVNTTSSDIAWGATLDGLAVSSNISADILNVAPDPVAGPIDQIQIRFSEPVNGFDLSDLRLTRNGGPNLFEGSQTLTSNDGITWTLGNLNGATAVLGDYLLQMTANGSGVVGRNSTRTLGGDAVEGFRTQSSLIRGGAGDDVWYLKLNGANVEIYTSSPPAGAPAYVLPSADLATLTIDGGAGNDTFQIASLLAVLPAIVGGGGSDRLVLDAGNWNFAADLSTSAGIERLVADGSATLTFNASQHLSSIELTGSARATLAAGGRLIRTDFLNAVDGAVLDLTDGNLIVQAADDASAATLLAAVSDRIKSARKPPAGALWTGAGITSSAAGSDDKQLTGLAVALNRKVDTNGNTVPIRGDLAGEPVDTNSILVKYTWNGDADVNGMINFDDYFLINTGFLSNGAFRGYRNGDFNFDAIINFDDYFLINSAFLGQGNRVLASAPASQLARPAAKQASVFKSRSGQRRPIRGHPRSIKAGRPG